MGDKPIRKMNREELVEMLIRYTEINEELETRVAQLESKLAEAEQKLQQRTIAISRAGSIAEAAMQLSGVFDAAQRAADQYLESIRRMYPAEVPAEAQVRMNAVRMPEKNEDERTDDPQTAQTITRRRKRGMGL